MCGIIGVFNNPEAALIAARSLKAMRHRGADGFGISTRARTIKRRDYKGLDIERMPGKDCIGHCLHSVVGYCLQPIGEDSRLSANCEIYNWKALNKKHSLNASNDAELLFRLIESRGIRSLGQVDGVYSFILWKDDKVYLARDIIGVKPLWYSHIGGFAAASEKKVLEKQGFSDVQELSPRTMLVYDIKKDRLAFKKRRFFSISPQIKGDDWRIRKKLYALIRQSVEKRAAERKTGLLFSGGVDSSFLALVMKDLGMDFTCYTAALDEPGMKDAEDLISAKKAAKELGLRLNIKRIRLCEVPPYLKKVIPLIEDSNVVKAGVGLTFYLACEAAHKDGVKVMFSGLGSEELFGGYERHRQAMDINKECLSGLLRIYERDLYRDDVITMKNSMELRLPFLDKKLVEFSLKIPSSHKIMHGMGKHILRQAAFEKGLGRESAFRKKKAAQYGSKLDRAIGKLAKRSGGMRKSEYLKQFYPSRNLRLGALASTGKDSIYALYVMKKQNYSIECLITMRSMNPDSYMFHTPNVDMAGLQAKAMGIPLVVQDTSGRKESELMDLKKALVKARKEHRIDGVITGALHSAYQRDRIERVCDNLGLKIFSPLWHLNQETEMREIIINGFEFVLSSVAAEGLDSSWLGRVITEKDVDKLVELSRNMGSGCKGINVAGEGGEFESLVIDCPLFEKKIKIIDSEIIFETENTAFFVVKKAVLDDK